MQRIVGLSMVLVGGGSLGALGLYFGHKLSRFRPHRKSEEFQTIFKKTDLD